MRNSKVAPASAEGSNNRLEGAIKKFESDLIRMKEKNEQEMKSMYGEFQPSDFDTDNKDAGDVLLSNDIGIISGASTEDAAITEELKKQFNTLCDQLDSFQQQNTKAAARQKELEVKSAEQESVIESLHDQMLVLEVKLRNAPKEMTGDSSSHARPSTEADYHRKTEQIRKALLADNEDDDVAVSVNDLLESKNIFDTLQRTIKFYFPLKDDIRQIQAKFGNSVASYFFFSRFVIFHMAILSLMSIGFLVLHIIAMSSTNRKITDYLSAQQFIPNLLVFSSFSTSEAFNFSLFVILGVLVTVLLLWYRIRSEDLYGKHMKSIASVEAYPYSQLVHCSWDNQLVTKEEVEDMYGKLSNSLITQLDAMNFQLKQKSRSRKQWAILYLRRVLGLFFYLVLLSLSLVAIALITVFSKNIQQQSESIRGLSVAAPFITPIVLAVINGGVPMVVGKITALEAWDSASMETGFVLLRVYLANTFNSGIVALSYLMLADPYILSENSYFRTKLELQYSTDYKCRMDQVANGLFTLVVSSWILKLGGFYAMPKVMELMHRAIRLPFKKSEFIVALNMVAMYNFWGLVFILIPFAPHAVVFVPVMTYLDLKWQKYCLIRWNLYNRPKKSDSAHNAGLIFTSFYLVTYILIGITVAVYFLSSKNFPKSCDIQDDNVGLCLNAPNPSTNVCSKLDTSSDYYDYFKNSKYPKSICEISCGPYVDSRNNITPFKSKFGSTTVFSYIWFVIVGSPYLSWLLVLIFSISGATTRNSVEVLRTTGAQKDRSFQAQLQAIQTECTRQERLIKKLKSIE